MNANGCWDEMVPGNAGNACILHHDGAHFYCQLREFVFLFMCPMQTLRLVKHIAQRGSPDFRRALARHSSAVRDLTAFRCAPDPFKGDIPWKRVQEYARESLEAIHAGPVNPSDSSTSRMVRFSLFMAKMNESRLPILQIHVLGKTPLESAEIYTFVNFI